MKTKIKIILLGLNTFLSSAVYAVENSSSYQEDCIYITGNWRGICNTKQNEKTTQDEISLDIDLWKCHLLTIFDTSVPLPGRISFEVSGNNSYSISYRYYAFSDDKKTIFFNYLDNKTEFNSNPKVSSVQSIINGEFYILNNDLIFKYDKKQTNSYSDLMETSTTICELKRNVLKKEK
ncbi:MAG: hypothetical protein HQK52_12810 [Oligoflexia bacterium]|nr:hypothetical protein [Oligoflexia bacterium]